MERDTRQVFPQRTGALAVVAALERYARVLWFARVDDVAVPSILRPQAGVDAALCVDLVK